MKVLHIATSTVGGAGIAANRLNDALIHAGVQSILISNKRGKKSQDFDIINVNKSLVNVLNSKLVTFGQRKLIQSGEDLITLYSASTLDTDDILRHAPDVIHIHSFYNLLNIDDINRLLNAEIPIFITLHDERVLTGACHCTNGCDHFELNCESCPQTRTLFWQAVSDEHFRWRKLFENEELITLICPSIWMERQVKRAGLNPNIQSAIVRNPISSEYLNLKIGETDKNLISSFTVTFVSHDLQNPYKGLDNVLNCIAIYSQEMNRQEIQFQFVGNGSKLDIKGIEFRQYPNLDELDLIDIYKSTDLLLVPSKTDNSPNVVFEAAMCGTPFLGSNRAGLPELSEIFGLRTFEFGNPESLYNAIVDLKHSEIDRANIRSLALQIVDPQKIAKTMKSLYQRKLTDAVSRRSGKDF